MDPEDTEDAFAEDIMFDQPDDERCIAFADYLVENYITQESRFPPQMWAGAPSDAIRTNNASESFHAHFNERFHSTHPNVFAFVDALLKIHTTTYLKVRSMITVALRKKCDREKDNFLIEQHRKLSSNEISRLQYLKAIGYKVMPRTT